MPWDTWTEAMPMEAVIAGAKAYTPCEDLWVITAYFNPCHVRSRLVHHQTIIERLERSGISVYTVECAFGSDEFDLPPAPNLLQVRSPHVLWQKERLLNLAVAKLPAHVHKVAWIDGDVIFANPDWAVQTSSLLEDFPVVQPFQRAIRLPPGTTLYRGDGEAYEGFARVWTRDPDSLYAGRLDRHGHTGFAWAARRDLLDKHGLYDAALDGTGDHLMVHAMCGDFDSPCVQAAAGVGLGENLRDRPPTRAILRLLRPVVPRAWRRRLAPWYRLRRINDNFKRHFVTWGRAFYQDVQGRVSYVPGTVLHLWHGHIVHEQYRKSRFQLNRHGFDPASDVRIGPSGCWEWNTSKPELHRWIEESFYCRGEEG